MLEANKVVTGSLSMANANKFVTGSLSMAKIEEHWEGLLLEECPLLV
jgi:hypothetical protein